MSEAVAVNPADTALPESESAPEATESSAPDAGSAEGAQAVADAVDPVKVAKIKLGDEEFDPEEIKSWRETAAKKKELERASFKRFEDAAKIQKQLEALRESDPEEFFKFRGIDPTQYAIEKLQREVAMREATPEQRAQLEREQALADREQKIQAQEQEYENRAYEAEKQQYIQRLDKELPTALQKVGLNPDPFVFQQMANAIATQLRDGIPEDYELAAETVRDSYLDSFKKHTATLKYEDAVKQYPDLVKTIRDGDLARARSPQAVTQKAPAPQRPAAPRAPEKSGSERFNDYFDPWAAMGLKSPA